MSIIRSIKKYNVLLSEAGSGTAETGGLVNSINDMNKTGAIAGFFSYLNSHFSIANLSSLNSSVINWCNEMSSKGTGFGKLLAGLGVVVSKTIEFAMSVCKSTLKSAPWLNNTTAGGFTYGTILGMAIVGACLLYVFNKIYKSIKNRYYESALASYKYQSIAIRKSLLESYTLFNKTTIVVESVQLTEIGIIQTVTNIIGRAWNMCAEMFEWASSVVVDTTSAIADFTQKHPKFVTAILICIGLVTAYHKCPAIRNSLNSVRSAANDAVNAVKDAASTAKS